MSRTALSLALALALLSSAMFLSGCGGSASSIGTSVPTPSRDDTPEPPKEYQLGATAQFGNHTMVANKVERADGIVTINLTVANTGSTDLVISSQLQFVARDSEDSRAKLLGDDEGSRGYWQIKPGEKLQDNLKFRFSPTAKGLKLYYTRTGLITTARAEPPAVFILE